MTASSQRQNFFGKHAAQDFGGLLRDPGATHRRDQAFGMAGAGEGNRTLVFSLGSCCSTIELHPHIKHLAWIMLAVFQCVFH